MNEQVSKWADLLTEQRNANSTHIDRCSTVDALRLINAEDQKVARAVEGVIDDVARAVDVVVSAFQKGRPSLLCRRGNQRSSRCSRCV